MTTNAGVRAGSAAGAVRLRSLREIDDDAVGRWWALAGRAAEPNPFAGPGVVLPAAAHLPDGGRAWLLSVERGGEMTFALPVVRTPAARLRPFAALTAWQGYFPPLATPLLDPAYGPESWRAVRSALAGRAVWLLLDPVTADGPVIRALLRAGGPGAAPRVLETVERAGAFPDDPADRDRVRSSPKTRKSLEARRRKLARMAGADAVTFRVDPGEPVPDTLVEDFLKLEAAGWKGAAGTALASRPETAAFFRDVVRAQAARRGAQVVGVRCGERLVAATVNLVAGGGLFFYKIAYDEEFRTASPGRILMADNLDAFADDPSLAFADSCADPGASLSNQVLRDRRPVARVLVPASGGTAALVTEAALAGRAARRRLRALRRGGRVP
ncbi:MAG TPA: GNAT family N-acetyltransferase [Streptosporangiaceae bacterium]|jgi:CelD/BcsL family acetyltransferase involved in cellulose biosynthesis